MKTKYIRYIRIVKHLIIFVITANRSHRYEIDHYWYMKRFRDIK